MNKRECHAKAFGEWTALFIVVVVPATREAEDFWQAKRPTPLYF